jgi:hypothetical protein
MKRLLLVAALALATAVPCATAATADTGGGANNVVIVKATADGATQARSHVQVVPVAGDTVASANIAAATATACTGCRASAVAVQVLLVTGDPSVFTPGNAATAVNAGCNGCGTFAYAWQYVLQTSGPVFLSPTGRLEVLQLQQEIDDAVAASDPTSLDDDLRLTAQLDTLTAQLKSVVDSEVQAAGVEAHGSPVAQVTTG